MKASRNPRTISETREFVVRVRTNDGPLRDLLHDAEVVLRELESAIARHDRIAERLLSYRAAQFLGQVDKRFAAIGATALRARLHEVDHVLREAVDRGIGDAVARRRSGSYSGRIKAIHDGPNGEKYFEQDVDGQTIYHEASAFQNDKPSVGQTVKVEYEDPTRAVVRAVFQPTRNVGERTRVHTDTPT